MTSSEVDNYLANYQSQPPQPEVEAPITIQAPPAQTNKGASVVVRPSQLSPSPVRGTTQLAPEMRQSTSPSAAEPRYYYNPNYVDARNKTPENERQNSPSQVPLPVSDHHEDAPVPPKFSLVQPVRATDTEHSVINKGDTLRSTNSERNGVSGSRFGPVNSAPDVHRPSNLSFGNGSSGEEPAIAHSDRVPANNQSGFFATPSFRPSQNPGNSQIDPRTSTVAQKYSVFEPDQLGGRRSTLDMSKVVRTSGTRSMIEPTQAVRPSRTPSSPAPVDFYQQVEVQEVGPDTPLSENSEKNLAIIDQFITENGLEPAVEHVIYNKEDEEFVVKLKENVPRPSDSRPSRTRPSHQTQRGTSLKCKIVPLFQLDPSRADALVDQGDLISPPIPNQKWHSPEHLRRPHSGRGGHRDRTVPGYASA